MSASTTRKQGNFELLRIISMLMITFFHYNIHGNGEGIFSAAFSANQVLSYALGSWGLVGVTCFFMISFWFMMDRDEISVKKWGILYGEVVTVDIICCIIASVLGESVGLKRLILCLIAPISNRYWYVTAYMLIMLLIPVLNAAVRNLSKRKMLFVTALSIVVNFILQPVYGLVGGGTGTSTLFLAVALYLITVCIKREYVRVEVKLWHVILSFALMILILCGLSFVATKMGMDSISNHIYDLVDIYSPFPVFIAVVLFMYFKDLKISVKDTIFGWLLLTLAKHTFAVYLLHENPLFRYLIWDSIFKVDVAFQQAPYVYICHMVLVVLVIFVLGEILDAVVSAVWNWIFRRRMFRKICRKLDSCVN